MQNFHAKQKHHKTEGGCERHSNIGVGGGKGVRAVEERVKGMGTEENTETLQRTGCRPYASKARAGKGGGR